MTSSQLMTPSSHALHSSESSQSLLPFCPLTLHLVAQRSLARSSSETPQPSCLITKLSNRLRPLSLSPRSTPTLTIHNDANSSAMECPTANPPLGRKHWMIFGLLRGMLTTEHALGHNVEAARRAIVNSIGRLQPSPPPSQGAFFFFGLRGVWLTRLTGA
jgi:hypothetical protein